MKTYTEMCARDTFLSRAEFLMLGGRVGEETFGHERHMNQLFYTSRDWKRARDVVILRDRSCDLGVEGFEIHDKIYVHHINPITPDMLRDNSSLLYDPENLICVSHNTHEAIHFGDGSRLPQPIVERRPGDHIGWERMW